MFVVQPVLKKRKEIRIPTSCDWQSSQALTRCSAQATVEWSLSPRYLCAPQHNDMAKFRFPQNFYLSSTTVNMPWFFAHSAVFVDNKASSFSPKGMFAQSMTQLVVVTLGQMFICILTNPYLRCVTRQQCFELKFLFVEFLCIFNR